MAHGFKVSLVGIVLNIHWKNNPSITHSYNLDVEERYTFIQVKGSCRPDVWVLGHIMIHVD